MEFPKLNEATWLIIINEMFLFALSRALFTNELFELSWIHPNKLIKIMMYVD